MEFITYERPTSKYHLLLNMMKIAKQNINKNGIMANRQHHFVTQIDELIPANVMLQNKLKLFLLKCTCCDLKETLLYNLMLDFGKGWGCEKKGENLGFRKCTPVHNLLCYMLK